MIIVIRIKVTKSARFLCLIFSTIKICFIFALNLTIILARFLLSICFRRFYYIFINLITDINVTNLT